MCGAKNVGSFRKNLSKGRLPEKSSITYEGLFSTYYFPIGDYETKEIVEPLYSVAQCPNVMTDEVEKFLCITMVSNKDGINKREDLNLIIVLDISGSMGSAMELEKHSAENVQRNNKRKTIMDVAKEVISDIVKEMRSTERLGIVLFDTQTEILQPFREVSLIDQDELLESISELGPRGGTNMEIGMKTAIEMLTDSLESDEGAKGKNNRIIFLTDAQPNAGGGKNSLLGLTKKAATQKIYTTFIGMGLDFNSKLVDQLTKVRGANYYSVNSQREFKKIMNEEFNFIVTPVCFNCNLFFESEGLEIEKHYGTPFSDESSTSLTKIETLTASPRDERGVQGGVILLKLREKLTPKKNPSMDVKLTLRYELTNGETKQMESSLNFKKLMDKLVEEKKIYQNIGIRKCILLCKFASLIRDTIDAANNKLENSKSDRIYSRNSPKKRWKIN